VQTVPTVNAATGPMPVLLLGGDTIIGGAQNRIINITILLKASRRPPSRLAEEMGRWNDGRRFAAVRPVDHALGGIVWIALTLLEMSSQESTSQKREAEHAELEWYPRRTAEQFVLGIFTGVTDSVRRHVIHQTGVAPQKRSRHVCRAFHPAVRGRHG
jgi:hypothetical protein